MKDYVIRTSQQLGPVLQGYRQTRGMTQAELGRAVGLPQSVISKLEMDPSSAGFGRLFKLLAMLELELAVRPRSKSTGPTEW